MKAIETTKAPIPAGHYSQGIVHNGFCFVAGQLPIAPGQTAHVVGSIEEQTEQALGKVEAFLRSAGSCLDRVVQMTIYVSEMDLWGGVNVAYKKVMGDHRPARAVVPVKDLHYGYQIEIQAIAAVD
jgi:2-iminobutanoate/2-iminopropanoate deaminase